MWRNGGGGWQQGGTDVTFEPARWRYTFLQERIKTNKQYYCLSFTLDFQAEDDMVSVAYCLPYTYSQLLRDIAEVEHDFEGCLEVRSLGRSRMGLEIPTLRITDLKEPDDKKKVVLAVGRIHPG